MYELIKPTLKDISGIYEKEFQLMVAEPISLKKLYDAREELIKVISSSITSDEKKFLMSLKQGTPEWSLLGVPNVEKLPCIQWKLLNIKKMAPKKREEQLKKLEAQLNIL